MERVDCKPSVYLYKYSRDAIIRSAGFVCINWHKLPRNTGQLINYGMAGFRIQRFFNWAASHLRTVAVSKAFLRGEFWFSTLNSSFPKLYGYFNMYLEKNLKFDTPKLINH